MAKELDSPQPERTRARAVFDLVKSNWLTLLLLGVLAVVLIRDRIPAWLRSRELVGRPAPDFVLQDLDGRTVRLSDFRGRAVLLNFWASWCLPCRVELPHLKSLQNDMPADRFAILSITSENANKTRAFAEKHAINYPVLLDPREQTLLQYRVREYPTLVWIDAEGRIQDVSLGLDPLLRWKVRYRVLGEIF